MKATRLIYSAKTGETKLEEIEFKVVVNRTDLKRQVDQFTARYIVNKLSELNEDLVDLASEYSLYLTKSELNDYQKQRKQFIEALFDWKEKVWLIEEQIENEIDNMADEELVKFEGELERVVADRYEAKLGGEWRKVISLHV